MLKKKFQELEEINKKEAMEYEIKKILSNESKRKIRLRSTIP